VSGANDGIDPVPLMSQRQKDDSVDTLILSETSFIISLRLWTNGRLDAGPSIRQEEMGVLPNDTVNTSCE
jgi:hypothetical protein